MLRKALSFGGMLLLVGAVVFTTPEFGQAAGHGGGHGGGGHYGGGFGGYHGGYNHGGYGHSFGSHPDYGYHHSYGYYPYRGYSDYYGSYPYYNTYPYVGSSYDSGYSGSYGDVGSSTPPAVNYQSFYPPATAATEPDNRAHVTVTLPAGAQVWFDGTATSSTGPVRQFDSPPLTPGSQYSYEVRARWNENGHEVTQTKRVEVTAGAHVNVNFPVPPKTAAQASAVK